MDVVQVVRTGRADPSFSYCASEKDCPLPSQLDARVPMPAPATLPPPPAPVLQTPVASKPVPNAPVQHWSATHSSPAALRTASGLSIAFPYKSAIFPSGARPLLEHWLKAKDQPGSRYLVIVHTEDSGPISRKLAQDRGDAVSQAIHQLLPPKQLDRTSVFDPYGRQVVVAIEPITPSPNPTSAASLAPPPKPIPAPSGEGSTEKSP
jgi:hypothetical protein